MIVQAGFVYVSERQTFIRMADVSTVSWYSGGYEYDKNNACVKTYSLEVTVAGQSIKIIGATDINNFMMAMNLDATRPE